MRADAREAIDGVLTVGREGLLGRLPLALPALNLRAADAEIVHNLANLIRHHAEILADRQLRGASEMACTGGAHTIGTELVNVESSFLPCSYHMLSSAGSHEPFVGCTPFGMAHTRKNPTM